MTTMRTKIIAAMMLCLMLAGGSMAIRSHAAAQSQSRKEQAQSADEELKGLLKARYDTAFKVLEAEKRRMETGKSPVQTVFDAGRCLLEAELELSATPKDRLAARQKHLDLTKALEDHVKVQFERGSLSGAELEWAQYWRLNAQVELLRAKGSR
jgi:hypothetical protein